MTIQTHTLNDGRKLGYAEFGNPSGKPIFYFPGGTISGLFAQAIHHPGPPGSAAGDHPGADVRVMD